MREDYIEMEANIESKLLLIRFLNVKGVAWKTKIIDFLI